MRYSKLPLLVTLAIPWMWVAPLRATCDDEKAVLPLPTINHPGSVAAQSVETRVQLGSFPMVLIAEIDSLIDTFSDPVFGDTDQDGLNEIISRDKNGPWRTVILEEQGNNTYVASFPLGNSTSVIPFATGDLDRDGKQELIGQRGYALQVFEALDGSSFPTELVWETSETNVVGHATVADSDADGHMEIINSRNTLGGPSHVIIYENSGDDQYVEVFRVPLSGTSRNKVVADLDGDGRPEVFVGTIEGDLYAFEAATDNGWAQTWGDSMNLFHANAVGGWDTDGNGKMELFVTGNNFVDDTWEARVYESTGDDAYEVVSTLAVPFAYSGWSQVGLGDLDGDGVGEFFFRTDSVNLFEAVAIGQWEPVGIISGSPDPEVASTYDLNNNGIWELIWTGNPTWILEHPDVTDVGVAPARVAALSAFPNPVRASTTVTWSAPNTGATLSVYDVAGRLVSSRRVGGPPFDLSARDLAAGVYLLRLERGGTPLAVGRITVRK